MTSLLRRVRNFYGSNPLHLLALLASFAVAGYAASFAAVSAGALEMLIWFAIAVVGHDLIMLPLYALADRSLVALVHPRRHRREHARTFPPVLNYVRLPAAGPILLMLIFLPSIIAQGDGSYFGASGQHFGATYLHRWLLVTAALFLLSAILYAARTARHATSDAATTIAAGRSRPVAPASTGVAAGTAVRPAASGPHSATDMTGTPGPRVR